MTPGTAAVLGAWGFACACVLSRSPIVDAGGIILAFVAACIVTAKVLSDD